LGYGLALQNPEIRGQTSFWEPLESVWRWWGLASGQWMPGFLDGNGLMFAEEKIQPRINVGKFDSLLSSKTTKNSGALLRGNDKKPSRDCTLIYDI
jgi:hypothetical protein